MLCQDTEKKSDDEGEPRPPSDVYSSDDEKVFALCYSLLLLDDKTRWKKCKLGVNQGQML